MSEQNEYVTAVFVVFENDDNDNDVCAFLTIKRYVCDCLLFFMPWKEEAVRDEGKFSCKNQRNFSGKFCNLFETLNFR